MENNETSKSTNESSQHKRTLQNTIEARLEKQKALVEQIDGEIQTNEKHLPADSISESNQRDHSVTYFIMIMIAFCSLLIRAMMHYQFHTSALLYVGLPFFIAVVLLQFVKRNLEKSWRRKLLNVSLISLVIMLGSSVVLFEGFLCVMMFMPIYFFVIFLVYISLLIGEHYKKKKQGEIFSHLLPLLILLSAFEGVSPELTFERHNKIAVTRVIDLSVADIQNNILTTEHLNRPRAWFLELFPMPHRMDIESFEKGAIHEAFFQYDRWFVTNRHSGSMRLQIEEKDEHRIRTSFIQDTSYISNYMTLKTIELQFDSISERKTKVTLFIEYDRSLDPAWYFGPMQRYAITKSAEFLMSEVFGHSDKSNRLSVKQEYSFVSNEIEPR